MNLLSFILLFCALVAEPFNNQELSLKTVLNELDRTIESKHIFEQKKQAQIDSILRSNNNMDDDTVKYRVYNELYTQYRYFNIDSALFYAANKLAIASEMKDDSVFISSNIDLAGVYINASMYSEAMDILENYGKRIRTASPIMYFHLCHSLATSIYQNNSDSSLKNTYYNNVVAYRDSLLSVLSTEDISHTFVLSEKYISQGQHLAAIELINKVYNSPEVSLRNKAILDYSLAAAYLGTKDTLKAEYYYAKSAISDLQTPVKEYKSLQDLAYLLYKKGDIQRAYSYIKCSMEDIASSNSRVRSQDIATILPIIVQTHDRVVERHKNTISIILVVIAIFFCISVVLLFVIYYQNNKLNKSSKQLVRAYDKLNEANTQLKTITRQTIELNRIKDTYVSQYMGLCSDYIDKLEKYRHDLLIIALTEPFERLIEVIKTPIIDMMIKEFYTNFDQTFIHICPNFIEDVNKLLKEEERLIPKQGKTLNTELRLLALIHLGVTDSEKIASILRCSLATVYNYRTKLRNAATGSRDSFEAKVANIGIIDL